MKGNSQLSFIGFLDSMQDAHCPQHIRSDDEYHIQSCAVYLLVCVRVYLCSAFKLLSGGVRIIYFPIQAPGGLISCCRQNLEFSGIIRTKTFKYYTPERRSCVNHKGHILVGVSTWSEVGLFYLFAIICHIHSGRRDCFASKKVIGCQFLGQSHFGPGPM